jgi:hypothetical protein
MEGITQQNGYTIQRCGDQYEVHYHGILIGITSSEDEAHLLMAQRTSETAALPPAQGGAR